MTLRGARLAGFILLSAASAWALDPRVLVTQYASRHWDAEHGLPQSSVVSLARTPDGYLWVGTEEGLARFDGVRFTLFNRANTPVLRSDLFSALAVGPTGTLWAGTRLGLFRLDHGQLVEDSRGLPEVSIASVLEDRQGRLWVGTLGAGLFRREPGAASFAAVPGVTRKRVRALAQTSGADLLVASEAGLETLTPAGTVEPEAALREKSCFALLQVRDELWVGCEGALLRRGAQGWQRLGRKDGLSSERIRTLAADAQGNLWIGTQDGGLDRWSASGGASALGVHNGFVSDSVETLLTDAEGSLWVGTSGGGLVQLLDSPVVGITRREGLPADLVFTVLEAEDGALYVGQRAHGLNRFFQGAVRTWTTADGLSSNDVTALAPDGRDGLWVGTYGGGLDHFSQGHFEVLHAKDGLASEDVSALLLARDGSLWIGTGGGGVQQRTAGGFRTWTRKDGLPDDGVLTLYEDRGGSIWVGTSQGIARISAGRLTAWTGRDGLPAPSVTAFWEAGDGTLYMGTAGLGLIRLRAGRFGLLTSRQGLPNDETLAILGDRAGTLYISSNRGLIRVTPAAIDAALDGHPAPLSATLLGPADGMPSAEGYGGSSPAAWRTRDGRLLFATIRGVAVVKAEEDEARFRPPPPRIEDVRVGGVSVPGPVRLPTHPSAVEIDYTALNLLRPDLTRFRYQLVGYDTDWIDAGRRRTAYYPKLPGGDFTFRVMASGPGGASAEPATLRLEVQRALWEQPWVRGAAAVLLVLLGFAVQRLRVWRLGQQKRALEALVTARTEELRAANAELATLASRDGLTRIANRRAFDLELARVWSEHRRRGASLAVVLCDVDHFKQYNDSCGHQAGDQTLQAVAQSLARSCRRATDFVARYGGEEFVLILQDTTVEGAVQVAQQQLDAIRQLKIPHPASSVGPWVTLSLGVAALVPGRDTEAAQLLAVADSALYAAKHRGRNRVASV